MCTFNTLLLPASTSLDRVNAVARELGWGLFAAQGNPSIEAAVADALSYVRADGGCDCGSGLATADTTPYIGWSDGEVRKLNADGWSATKIERWKAQREAARAKVANPAQPTVPAQWCTLLERLLDGRIAAWVGVFTHDYRGALGSRITCKPVQRFSGVTVDRLSAIETDVPYVFAR